MPIKLMIKSLLVEEVSIKHGMKRMRILLLGIISLEEKMEKIDYYRKIYKIKMKKIVKKK